MSEKLKDISGVKLPTRKLVLAENVHAGFPSPAADYFDQIDITDEIIRHPETTFYARIDGDSMRDAGIHSGDIVVIDRSLVAQDGNFVAAYIDGEFTIKEYRFDESEQCAWLIPHNPQFSPIRVTNENAFLVWGVITYIIHRFANIFA